MELYQMLKDAIRAVFQLGSVELKQKLADSQVERAKLAGENAQLRQELTELREKNQARREMEYKQNVYWRRLEGENREGPYCPKCFDGSGKTARMADTPDNRYWNCPVCSLMVEKPGWNPGPPKRSRAQRRVGLFRFGSEGASRE